MKCRKFTIFDYAIKPKGVYMKKKNIELDYNNVLDLRFIEHVGSPLDVPLYGPNCKKMIQPVKDLKILVIRLESCAELYALNNSVIYVTDNKEKYDKFLNKVNDEKFGSDDGAILFDDWKNIDKLMENKKFDVCIMNPPYDKNLHLQILEKVIKFCDKVVNISPIRWLQDPLFDKKKNSALTKFANVAKHIKNVEILNNVQTQELFGAVLNMTMGIYMLDEHGGWLNPYVNNDIIKKMQIKAIGIPVKPYKNRSKSIFRLMAGIIGGNGCSAQKENVYFLYSPKIYGNYFVNDKSDVFNETLEECKKLRGGPWGTVDNWSIIEFDSLIELNNFNQWIATKVMQYYFTRCIIDVHVYYTLYPYMQDYTHSWTDKDLCKFFNITGYIDDNTAESGSEWETILNSFK